ncbi:MAG: DUF4124 domain-containing protein [Gammaproteobacteria bacterium]
MIYTQPAIALLLCLTATSLDSQAATIYRWTDSGGQTHFSDTAPIHPFEAAIETLPDRAGKPAGLRPGERAAVRDIEQRRQQRHRTAERARQLQRRQRAADAQDCRQHREQQRRGRRHADGKALSKFLRRNCW